MEAFVSTPISASSFVGSAVRGKSASSSPSSKPKKPMAYKRTVSMKFGSAKRKFDFARAIDQNIRSATQEMQQQIMPQPWTPAAKVMTQAEISAALNLNPFEKPVRELGTGLLGSSSYTAPKARFAPQPKRNLLKNVVGQYSPAVNAWVESQKVKGGLATRNLLFAKSVAAAAAPTPAVTPVKVAAPAPVPVMPVVVAAAPVPVPVAAPAPKVVEAPRAVQRAPVVPVTVASIKDEIVTMLNLPGLKKSAPAPKVAPVVAAPVAVAAPKVEPVVVARAVVQPPTTANIKKDVVQLLVLPEINYKNVVPRAAPAAPASPKVTPLASVSPVVVNASVVAPSSPKASPASPKASRVKKGTRSPLEAFVVGLVSALLGQPKKKDEARA